MSKTTRALSMFLLVGVVAATGVPLPANAVSVQLESVVSSGKRSRDTFSLKIFSRCGGKTYRGQRNCSAVIVVVDPPVQAVTEIDMDLSYDPSLWIFRPLESGFLCDFTASGGCPPAHAQLGTFEVEALEAANFVPGAALPGSTPSVVNDSTNGVVSLHYLLGQPLFADGEQNFYSFYFEAVNPFADISRVSYFNDVLGSYDFAQSGARCITVTGECASTFPVAGINFTLVSAPGSGALVALGLLALAATRRRD